MANKNELGVCKCCGEIKPLGLGLCEECLTEALRDACKDPRARALILDYGRRHSN